VVAAGTLASHDGLLIVDLDSKSALSGSGVTPLGDALAVATGLACEPFEARVVAVDAFVTVAGATLIGGGVAALVDDGTGGLSVIAEPASGIGSNELKLSARVHLTGVVGQSTSTHRRWLPAVSAVIGRRRAGRPPPTPTHSDPNPDGKPTSTATHAHTVAASPDAPGPALAIAIAGANPLDCRLGEALSLGTPASPCAASSLWVPADPGLYDHRAAGRRGGIYVRPSIRRSTSCRAGCYRSKAPRSPWQSRKLRPVASGVQMLDAGRAAARSQ
jgi:hypothetical protein